MVVVGCELSQAASLGHMKRCGLAFVCAATKKGVLWGVLLFKAHTRSAYVTRCVSKQGHGINERYNRKVLIV